MAERVKFQLTPNPNAAKFVVGRAMAPPGTSRSYHSAEEAADDPLARRLMALDGVRSVFMVNDFVTVSKHAAAGWDSLAPRVSALLEEER